MSEIILCETCKGLGYQQFDRLTDYHKGEYYYWKEVCKTCLGKGRRKKTITTTYEPLPDVEMENGEKV